LVATRGGAIEGLKRWWTSVICGNLTEAGSIFLKRNWKEWWGENRNLIGERRRKKTCSLFFFFFFFFNFFFTNFSFSFSLLHPNSLSSTSTMVVSVFFFPYFPPALLWEIAEGTNIWIWIFFFNSQIFLLPICSLSRISWTLPPRLRPGGTSLRGSCRVPTPSSWTSSAPVIFSTALHFFSRPLLRNPDPDFFWIHAFPWDIISRPGPTPAQGVIVKFEISPNFPHFF